MKPKIKPIPTATGRRYHVLDVRGALLADVEDPATADVIVRVYLKGLEEAARIIDEGAQTVIDAIAETRHAARELVLASNPDPRQPATASRTVAEGGIPREQRMMSKQEHADERAAIARTRRLRAAQ